MRRHSEKRIDANVYYQNGSIIQVRSRIISSSIISNGFEFESNAQVETWSTE
jgi:hypothetical protein